MRTVITHAIAFMLGALILFALVYHNLPDHRPTSVPSVPDKPSPLLEGYTIDWPEEIQGLANPNEKPDTLLGYQDTHNHVIYISFK